MYDVEYLAKIERAVGSEEEFGPWLTTFYPRFALMGDSLPRLCAPSTAR